MQFELLAAWRDRQHVVVQLLERRAGPEQAEPRADARYVRVDGDVWHPEAEQQHAGRRLASDARKGAELCPRRRDVEVREMVERRRVAERAQDPLDPLDGPHLRDQDFLTSLPGVGRKTAACVRLFAYGERDVPVDTHVSRVGTRLGLFRERAPFQEMHDEMLAITPRGQELEFHVNLLRHGRRTCHARRPACEECPLLRMCPTGYNLRHAD